MATLSARLFLDKLPHFITAAGGPLESDERLTCVDMICEGPIEGLVDKDGDLLKFISDNDNDLVDSLVLGKGTYYKNVPLIDSRFNKLNFVTAGFNISYGSEINEFKNQYPSTVHRYNQKIYLSETDVFDNTCRLWDFPSEIIKIHNPQLNQK